MEIVVVFFVLFYLVLFALMIGSIVLWVWMLIDAIIRPEWQYPSAQPGGNQKLIWILVLVLAGGIGGIVYYFVIYKKAGKANSSLPAPPWWGSPAYAQAVQGYWGQAQPYPAQPYPPPPAQPYPAQPYPPPPAQPYPPDPQNS